LVQGNYEGPGTKLKERILKKKIKGVDNADNISKLHDINYTLANNKDDIRVADEKMLNSLKKNIYNPIDLFNATPAYIGIKSKTLLEDYAPGFLTPDIDIGNT
jgi:hypothetical protein